MASIPVVDGLDVAALRLFLDVVELGSVSKAAVRHGLAQPSATAKLQKLERQLGVQLLDRSPSGSVATAAGVQLGAGLRRGRRRRRRAGRSGRGAAATSSTASPSPTTRHVADHFLPGWIAAAELDDVRLDLDRGRHARPSPRPCGQARPSVGFTEGPAAPLGLRSEVVASRGDRPGRRAAAPLVRPPSAGRPGATWSAATSGAAATRVRHARRRRGRAGAAYESRHRRATGVEVASSAAARLAAAERRRRRVPPSLPRRRRGAGGRGCASLPVADVAHRAAGAGGVAGRPSGGPPARRLLDQIRP